MIDLTPLDVRKKRGDFGRGVRGYNPQEVDGFLELVAERLEELVKENMTLRERAERLSEQVHAQTGREQAVQQALVTAQQLREEIQTNAQKEAELVVQQARARGREVLAAAERQAVERTEGLHELELRRLRFLASYRQFLERELDHVSVEEGKELVSEVTAVDLDLGRARPFRYDPGGIEAIPDDMVFPSLVEEEDADADGSDSGRKDPDGEGPAGSSAKATSEVSWDPEVFDDPSGGGEAGTRDRAPDPEARAGEDESAPDGPDGGHAPGSDSVWMPNFPRKSRPGED